jgi:hypothetical protein
MTPVLACHDAPGSLRSHDQRGAGVIPSPIPALPGYIVPAAPILELVARRQSAWGFSDADMRAYLGPACSIVDARGVLSRRQAEAILLRLLTPAKGTPRSATMARRLACTEAQQHVPGVPTVRQRIAGKGRFPSKAPRN